MLLSACSADGTFRQALRAESARYTADAAFIAQAPRTAADAHHQAVRDLCPSGDLERDYYIHHPGPQSSRK